MKWSKVMVEDAWKEYGTHFLGFYHQGWSRKSQEIWDTTYVCFLLGSSHWIGRVWCSRKETDLKIWSDCRTQHAYSDQHGTSSMKNYFPTYPTTQTKANQPEIRTGRTTIILIVLLGGVALTRADFTPTPPWSQKMEKKNCTRNCGNILCGPLDCWFFPFVFVLSISTWWHTSHVTHVAILDPPVGKKMIETTTSMSTILTQLKLRDPPTFAKTFLHFELGQLLS